MQKEVLRHETPDRLSWLVGDVAETIENCDPFHCSMSVSELLCCTAVWPTATHQVVLTHDTESRLLPGLAGCWTVTPDQLDPFHI
jgi:hypothetical protein